MGLQINEGNFAKALNACCRGGAIDRASIKDAAQKYGFDAKVLEDCSNIFEAENKLKGLVEK